MARVFEVGPSDLELDAPLPAFIVNRPKVEGSQSRSELIIELAVREQLTVREVLSRLGGGRGHFTLVGTPDQVADVILEWFNGEPLTGLISWHQRCLRG